jgi:hypothetical protein
VSISFVRPEETDKTRFPAGREKNRPGYLTAHSRFDPQGKKRVPAEKFSCHFWSLFFTELIRSEKYFVILTVWLNHEVKPDG